MKLLEEFIKGFTGKTISVAVQDLESGREIFINADVMMHPASTMKVPVMMELFRQAEAGLFSLDDKIIINNSFKSIVDGSEFNLSVVDDSGGIL